ncbi:hypothetical protein V8G54_005726 [Vigna mungo]|uniref:Uncharacterized protein n=1 Tax=Vigna mungo TaxID=3915 RepID=A0AAQ3NYJ4_VIGMU
MVEPQIIEMIDWVGGEEGHGVDAEVHTEGLAKEGGEVNVEDGDVQVEDADVQVEDDEVHHVQEPEVHEVDDFEVEDLGEDDDVEDSEGEEVDESEDESESEEEDLHDVTVQCDIGTSKGNVREEHSSPLLESSQSSDNEKNMHDVRGLSDNE